MLPNSNSALRQTLCSVKLTPASFLKSGKAPSPRSATSPGDRACQGPEQDDARTRHQPPNHARRRGCAHDGRLRWSGLLTAPGASGFL